MLDQPLTPTTPLWQYFRAYSGRPNHEDQLTDDLMSLCYGSYLEILDLKLDYIDGLYYVTLYCQHPKYPWYKLKIYSRVVNTWKLCFYGQSTEDSCMAMREGNQWCELMAKFHQFVH